VDDLCELLQRDGRAPTAQPQLGSERRSISAQLIRLAAARVVAEHLVSQIGYSRLLARPL
jgi:hypothetical protein